MGVEVQPDVIPAASYPLLDYDQITIQKNRVTGKTTVTALIRKYKLDGQGAKVFSPLTVKMAEADLNAWLAAHPSVAQQFLDLDAGLQAAMKAYGQAKGTF